MPSPKPRTWTPEQAAAIAHAGGGGLLVSAAAGSGKTSVLAERCAHVVCDAADPCGVHELLVVTFTEAAATEMRDRIGKALHAHHGRDPDDPHVARQLATLDRASISTLHGFCSRLLRQHFHRLGLDPAFRILDADEATLLKQEVARDLFADRYDADGDAGKHFRGLIDRYGDGDDTRLVEQVIAGHESLASVVDPGRWRADARARLAEATGGRPLRQTELGRALLADIGRGLDGLAREAAAADRAVRALGKFDAYTQRLAEVSAMVRHLRSVLDDHGLDAVREEVDAWTFDRLKPVASTVPNKEQAKARIDAVQKLAKDGDWRRWLAFGTAHWSAGMAATAGDAGTLLSLVEAFEGLYARAKESTAHLDFNDLERLTLAVLSDDAGRPSAVARQCHGLYRHVMVDEYQDINGVQDAILRRVSRECLGRPNESNLFCVGDVKQSIYRFRLADPQQFLARRAAYAAGAGRVIDLRQNFRSRGPLIDAINAVFRSLMTAEAADLDYDESHELVMGADWPPPSAASFSGSPVELHLLPKSAGDVAVDAAAEIDGDDAELDRTQREAVLVGRRVLDLVGRGDAPAATVVDRDGTVRPATFGDCVVLLRSMRFKSDVYAKQLRAMGVPVHSESRTGYFEATEVNDVLSLLRVLDNGRQDVPLAAVLRSPLANLPAAEDALARVRLAFPAVADGTMAFHEAVYAYPAAEKDELGAKLTDVLAQLARWRQVARDRPVAELLWAVYTETGYLAFCGGLPRGDQRQANLVELHDRARQFGEFRRQGLGRFLTFLERLRAESDLGQAAVAGEADDVVRLMSVHHAKGLEFPVVFVPDLGKLINTADTNGSILLDRDLGLGLQVVDEERQVRYPSLAHAVVRQQLRRHTWAEELRVLYVALTRAKEHLVLVGTADETTVDRWWQQGAGHDGPLPAEFVLAAKTPLEWLVATAAAVGERFIRVSSHTADDVNAGSQAQATAPTLSPEQAARAALDELVPPPPRPPAADAVIDGIGRAYPHQAMTGVEAAAAATAVAKRAAVAKPAAVATESLPVLSMPRFLADATPIGATDRGSATHAVLERLDFAVPPTAAAIRAEVDRLSQSRRVTAEQADSVDVDAIVWFLSTDLGRLMRERSADLRREVPLYFARPEPPSADPSDPADQVMVRRPGRRARARRRRVADRRLQDRPRDRARRERTSGRVRRPDGPVPRRVAADHRSDCGRDGPGVPARPRDSAVGELAARRS